MVRAHPTVPAKSITYSSSIQSAPCRSYRLATTSRPNCILAGVSDFKGAIYGLPILRLNADGSTDTPGVGAFTARGFEQCDCRPVTKADL